MATQAASSESVQSDKIDIRDVPVLVEWTADGQPRCLGISFSSTPATLDIDFDSSTQTASFRLRVVLFRRHSDKPVPVYVIISPKTIQSVVLPDPSRASTPEGGPMINTRSLLFRLHKPATFVVPPDPLRLNDKQQASVLRLVRAAARQTVLSVSFQADLLLQAQLNALSDATYLSFEQSGHHADLSTLYGGRGGKILESTAVDEGPTDSPPSYNEIEAPPPMPPISDDSAVASSSKKRRRSTSPTRSFDLSLVETLCRKIIREHEAEAHKTLQTELSHLEHRIIEHVEQQVNGRVQSVTEAWQAQVERLEGHIQELRRDTRDLKDTCQLDVKRLEAQMSDCQDDVRRLDERCQDDLERLEEQIQTVSDDIDQRVDIEIEDQMLGIKVDLERFVKDELKNSEETLKERLADASLSLHFND